LYGLSADCEHWGNAALLHHPVAGAETLCLDLEDEMVVIATRDRRWQIETSPGETVVRAVGASSPAHIKLKPDGTVEIHGTRVDLGAAALSDAQRVAIGALVDARLTKLQAAFDAHVHASVTSLGTPTPPTAVPGVIPVGPLASVAATKTRAQ
jgi:hypothetical protein